MGANTEDMINQLQMQQMMPPQPSFMGIQAPPDPQAIRALLQHLQAQQAVAQTGNTPGQYGYLHDAGQKAFASIGQGLGGALGGALNAPPPSSGPSQQSSQLMQARAKYAQDIADGVPENTARQTAAKALVQAGFPQAPDLLEKAVSAGVNTAHVEGETAHNLAQAASDTDEIKNRAFEQQTKTWKDTYTDPNGLFKLQTNGTGETRRVELKPPPSAAAQMAANIDPQSIQFAADTYRTTGKFPGSFGRSPAMMQAVLKQVAADALANGDTAGAIQARVASLKAGGTALDQVTKQEAFTGSAVATLDKNLTALQAIGTKLDSTGSPLINKAVNHFNQGVSGDPSTAAYVTMLNAVQGEYAKIASNNNGNSPISDSAKADAKEVINKAMTQGGIAAVRQAMMQESQNRMQAIREAKQGLIGTLSGNAPGAPQGAAPQQAGPSSAPAVAGAAPAGWTLQVDAKGNKAYVSPDKTQFQEVK